MRIAIASRQVAGVSGATTLILEQVRRLALAGWEPHVYGEKLDARRILELGGKPHRLPGLPWGSFLKRRLFAWLFERAASGRRFDLVCGHGDILRQDVLTLHNCVHAAHEAVHGTPLLESSGVGRLHARQLREQSFRFLIANSELMRRDVIGRFGVPADKTLVIHPGYDPERFRPGDRQRLGAPLRRELGLGPGDVLVGLITSGDFAKRGVAPFLASLARMSAVARSKASVLVMGQEHRLAPYRRLAPSARFLPPAPDVERYYHALDICVHPALFEEFGLSVQEAMACGVPVLTSKRVGASELLEGQARSMLLEGPDEEALAAALERLILDADMRRRWGEQAHAAVKGNTWDEYFRKVLACYERVLAGS